MKKEIYEIERLMSGGLFESVNSSHYISLLRDIKGILSEKVISV